MSSSTIAGAVSVPRIANWAKVMLVMAVLGEMCLAGDFYGFAAVMPFVSKSLNLNPGQAGLVQGAFGVTYAIGMFVWAPLGRRMSSRVLYVIGLGGSGLLMLVQAHAASFESLLALRLVIGFFDAAVWVGSMKIILEWFPVKRQGLMMGIILAAYSLAITLDFAAGIPYTIAHGWPQLFSLLGVLTLIVGGIALVFSRTGPYADPHATASSGNAAGGNNIGAIFRSRWLYIGILAIFGDLFALAASATWVIPNFIKTQGLPVAMAATVGAVLGLAQIGFLLVGGWVADKIARETVLKIGAVLALAAALMCLATTIWTMPVPVLMLVAVLCGVAVFSGGAIFSLVGERFGPSLGAPATAYAEVGGVLATFVAPALMGFILEWSDSFTAAFWAFVAVEAIVVAVLFSALRDKAAVRTVAA
jgi:MFS family permease